MKTSSPRKGKSPAVVIKNAKFELPDQEILDHDNETLVEHPGALKDHHTILRITNGFKGSSRHLEIVERDTRYCDIKIRTFSKDSGFHTPGSSSSPASNSSSDCDERGSSHEHSENKAEPCLENDRRILPLTIKYSSSTTGKSPEQKKDNMSSSSFDDFRFSKQEQRNIPIVKFNCQALSKTKSMTSGQKLCLSFKTINADSKLVSQICHAHGFREVHPSNQDYNLVWTGVHPKPHIFKSMLPHQRCNHFPRSYELTRKDRLYQNIERMQYAKGAKHFNFVPKTFMIPNERSEFIAAHHRMRGAWIVKPAASSRGRGIFIVNHPSQVPLDESIVVAKYIENPLLVNGHKWDIRLYVAVTSYDPLVVYLYEEGLVRFATVQYDPDGKNLWNPCMHLCNYSINKYHSNYIKCDDPDQEDQGHKWTLSALLRHLKASNINTVKLMQRIEDVIIKSIISVEVPVNNACKMFVPHKQNCFELYGFDILIDSELKPWLLEVNLSPSLNCDAPIDMKIKSALICDLLNLIGLPEVDSALQRAQNDRRVNGPNRRNRETSSSNLKASNRGDAENAAKNARRSASVEARRFASAPRLHELENMVKNTRLENERRGGFVRIFPTPETWQNYGSILGSNSQNNLILHEQLYPDSTKKTPKLSKRIRSARTYDFTRTRSQSAGHGKNIDIFDSTRNNSSADMASPNLQDVSSLKQDRSESSEENSMRHSNSLMKPNELPKCNENNRYEFQSEKFAHKFSLVDESVRPTSQEMRTAQYEKSLTKGYWPPKTITKMDHSNDMAKKMVEKCQRSAVLKKDIIQMIESGLQLSEYQSRTAFSVYLQCILQSLSDFNEERGSEVGQTEEVLKFLQKAALSLREPYYLKAPSNKLSGKDRAAVVAKELHEFLSHYKRETELYALFIDEPKMIARHQFEEFIANAIDSDLEDVLILQTKRYHCAHIFLGKCLPPAIGQKNCLFRTAYGISPDRNLRDRLCSIRMNARSNY